MRYVEAAGVRVSAIGVGCWQFGASEWGYGRGFESTAMAIVDRALDLGVNLLDTAEMYAWGTSEAIVGRAVADRRAEAFVATKLLPVVATPNWTYDHGRLSAMRLGVEQIDLYQLHWPNPVFPLHRTMQGMRRLVSEGIVGHVGVSNYSARRWRKAEAELGAPVLSNQVRYSLVDRRPEKAVLPYAQAHDRIVIAYSPLAQGLLGGRYDVDHRPTDTLRRFNPLFLPENLERSMPLITALREIGAGYGATPAQVALAWLIHHPNVVAIPGASSVEQLEHNAAAADLELREDEVARLTAASDSYAPVPLPTMVPAVVRERRLARGSAPARPSVPVAVAPDGSSEGATGDDEPAPATPIERRALTDVSAPLERLRSLCSMLPETTEVDALGHPTFRVSVKAFAVYEVVAGSPTVCVKLDVDEQRIATARPGMWPEPDTGEHGWTVVDLSVVSWPEVDPLVVASYRQVAAPELVAELDARLGATSDGID